MINPKIKRVRKLFKEHPELQKRYEDIAEEYENQSIKEQLENGCGFQDTYNKSNLCKKGNLCSECRNSLNYFNQGKLSQIEDEIKWLNYIKQIRISNQILKKIEYRINQLNKEIEELKNDRKYKYRN
jgi:hypothetical protein